MSFVEYGLLALQFVELLRKYLSLVESDFFHDLMPLSLVNGLQSAASVTMSE